LLISYFLTIFGDNKAVSFYPIFARDSIYAIARICYHPRGGKNTQFSANKSPYLRNGAR